MSRRKKKFNKLPQAKQLAKQLLLHRVWDGQTQSDCAAVLDTKFQQYQKYEKCQNRIAAEQLLALCEHYKWDPRIIFFDDPVKTLNTWANIKPLKNKSGINNSVTSILKRFYKIDIYAEKLYNNERSN